ncbi:probable ATP-dependent RNA helicase DDX56 [Cimex lectularius]|uniref:RNA helicase n=1 Tax=Cimex lectularius TaxID=79782 RepID=A0A8I6S3H4_CIMLE|nr:probable ATP-dependent RNA helicase DDX56 [Cimex lectularius]
MDEHEEEKQVQFHEMGVDDRILKAIAKLCWLEPTPVQERAIPLLIEGKDVLIRARTGSGKTGAFAIPAIQKILSLKESSPEQHVRILVLGPTKELCHQIHKHILQLTTKCSREVRAVDVSPQVDIAVQKPLLVDLPDIVIGTPARVLKHINASTLNLKELVMVIIDEADLMFSFGYESDTKEVVKHLPRVCQGALASATLSEDVLSLKKLVLHNAVTLKLQESELAPITQLSHYKVYAEKDDKPAYIYTFLKLGLIRGKTIIFVNTVDKGYKLKLFLEQFKIPSSVLNSELPAASRCHTISQFNQGKYDILIASDEATLDDPFNTNTDKQKSKRVKDQESGVSRGIDFQEVSTIINFDFPMTINLYIHRAGRTARGLNKGTVLSLINVGEAPRLEDVDNYLKQSLTGSDTIFKEYKLSISEIESFKYRSRDAWKTVTRSAVREARLKEIKQEILNSQKLKGYFDDNPRDLKTLRHDKVLKTVRGQPHLSNVPEYIVPESLKNIPGLVKVKKAKKFKPSNTENMKYKFKRSNPLSGFDFDKIDEELNKTKRRK